MTLASYDFPDATGVITIDGAFVRSGYPLPETGAVIPDPVVTGTAPGRTEITWLLTSPFTGASVGIDVDIDSVDAQGDPLVVDYIEIDWGDGSIHVVSSGYGVVAPLERRFEHVYTQTSSVIAITGYDRDGVARAGSTLSVSDLPVTGDYDLDQIKITKSKRTYGFAPETLLDWTDITGVANPYIDDDEYNDGVYSVRARRVVGDYVDASVRRTSYTPRVKRGTLQLTRYPNVFAVTGQVVQPALKFERRDSYGRLVPDNSLITVSASGNAITGDLSARMYDGVAVLPQLIFNEAARFQISIEDDSEDAIVQDPVEVLVGGADPTGAIYSVITYAQEEPVAPAVEEEAEEEEEEEPAGAEARTLAIDFPGGSGGKYLSASSAPPVPSSDKVLTLDAWVYVDAVSGTQQCVGRGTGGSGFYWRINSAGKIQVLANGSAVLTSGTISAVTWTYICATWDGSDVVVYYGDYGGSLTTEVLPFTASVTHTGQTMILGGDKTLSSYKLNGRLAEIGYWDSTLDADAVSERFNSGSGTKYSDLSSSFKTTWGLLAYYGCQDTSGGAVDEHAGYDCDTEGGSAGTILYQQTGPS